MLGSRYALLARPGLSPLCRPIRHCVGRRQRRDNCSVSREQQAGTASDALRATQGLQCTGY
eukprot:273435-Prymnesium_polylepis.1